MAQEIKRAYDVEKKANEELEKLGNVKNQFLMTIQHHLRTPLTSMRGYTDLLLSGSFGKVPVKIEEVLKRFDESTSSLIKMVNDFLDITQFQLGKDVISVKDGVNLSPMLENIVADIKLEADKKGILLKLEKPAGDCIIRADESKLKAALVNLFDNSVKYTKEGSVAMNLEVLADKVKISIKDTGMGIAKERLEKLFESTFERTEEAKKTFTTGRGVGLYLSSQIIKAHHGKVWAESEGEGKGSTFFIELPIK
jgi:signal transduction histidine kinase